MVTGCSLRPKKNPARLKALQGLVYGGEGGIRTLERVTPLPVFKTGAFDHSATSPLACFPGQASDCNNRRRDSPGSVAGTQLPKPIKNQKMIILQWLILN
jgi:hypothetical protein